MRTEKRTKKSLLMVVSALLVVAICAMGTLAYLSSSLTGDKGLVNTFTAAGGGVAVDPTNPDDPNGPNTDPTVPDGTIQDGFYLLESKAVYADGAYTLGTTRVLKNTYDKSVPGLEIPKDPTLTLNVAEDVAVYVYVKVTDTSAGDLEYTVDAANWTEVSGLSGLGAGEKVYCYKNAVQTGTADVELVNVGILTGNKVTIANNADTYGQLKFEAYVCQAGGFNTPAAAFEACF